MGSLVQSSWLCIPACPQNPKGLLPTLPIASSGSDSSDIETLECPGPDDFYEDHALAYDSMHSSLMSCSLRSFTFVGDSGELTL